MDLDAKRVDCDGIAVNVLDAGDGEPIVLLHGFPNSSELWLPLVPHLTVAGYRVIAPDLRGFGASDAPEGKQHYRLSRVAADVCTVMDALGVARARLVGHDWGSALGWLLAGTRPDRFTSYAALSVGHPYAYRQGGMKQLLKAWYIFLFLCPGVAEATVSARDWRLFRRYIQHPGVESWIRDLARPGRLTAAMNWYRANALNPGKIPRCEVPVLGVWSSRDVALTEAQMTASSRFVDAPWRYERFADLGHWFPLDAPAKLAALLLDFFATA